MNLLLVDDEAYVIDSIRENLDWEACGVEKLYTAYSMQQAQKLMELAPIDVIISDIVMPGGSGFDFVEWVRERESMAQVIFLTSYAEFDYARRAIALDSVDYLLKPIDYGKLKEAVKSAVARADAERERRKESRQWQKSLGIVWRDLWRQVLNGSIKAESFAEEAKRRNLPCVPNARFFLLLFEFKDMPRGWEKNTLYFILENVLSELLEREGAVLEALLDTGTGGIKVICMESEKPGGKEKTEAPRAFIAWIRENLKVDVWCGVGTPEPMPEFLAQEAALPELRDDTLSVWNRVLYLGECGGRSRAEHVLNTGLWKTLLDQGKKAELLEGIARYLREEEERELITRDLLNALRTDVTQLVYSHLAGKEIMARELFSGEEDKERYREAVRDCGGAIAYAEHLIGKALDYQDFSLRTDSVAERLCRYMDSHYREEIRREDLGALVFLNEDYMSRIFKKETGMSISAYLLQKRVEEAKKLLTQSRLPINAVSINVGYSNFSYFTKMFRENTGYSPLEYRRNYAEKNEGGKS